MVEFCCYRGSRRGALRCCGCPIAYDLLGETSRSRFVSFAISLLIFLLVFRSLFGFTDTSDSDNSSGASDSTLQSRMMSQQYDFGATDASTATSQQTTITADPIVLIPSDLEASWAMIFKQTSFLIMALSCAVANSKTQHSSISIIGLISIGFYVYLHWDSVFALLFQHLQPCVSAMTDMEVANCSMFSDLATFFVALQSLLVAGVAFAMSINVILMLAPRARRLASFKGRKQFNFDYTRAVLNRRRARVSASASSVPAVASPIASGDVELLTDSAHTTLSVLDVAASTEKFFDDDSDALDRSGSHSAMSVDGSVRVSVVERALTTDSASEKRLLGSVRTERAPPLHVRVRTWIRARMHKQWHAFQASEFRDLFRVAPVDIMYSQVRVFACVMTSARTHSTRRGC
jgi:hypothetical protein